MLIARMATETVSLERTTTLIALEMTRETLLSESILILSYTTRYQTDLLHLIILDTWSARETIGLERTITCFAGGVTLETLLSGSTLIVFVGGAIEDTEVLDHVEHSSSSTQDTISVSRTTTSITSSMTRSTRLCSSGKIE
jgi:hypothetical protein